MRVHVCAVRMTLHRADVLEAYLNGQDNIQKATVYERTGDVVLTYRGSRKDAAALLARTDLRPDAPVLHIDFGRTFQRYITAIYEARGQSAWSRTQMLGYAYLLLGKLIEGREGPEDRGDVIDRAAAYIENNYAEPITVDDIAAFAGVSRSWLYRGFMQRFGRSPTALLRETRLKTARTLLRGTTMHISEIAWSVGYPDALYFSRVFAASEGCSPSVYRAGQEHT